MLLRMTKTRIWTQKNSPTIILTAEMKNHSTKSTGAWKLKFGSFHANRFHFEEILGQQKKRRASRHSFDATIIGLHSSRRHPRLHPNLSLHHKILSKPVLLHFCTNSVWFGVIRICRGSNSSHAPVGLQHQEPPFPTSLRLSTLCPIRHWLMPCIMIGAPALSLCINFWKCVNVRIFMSAPILLRFYSALLESQVTMRSRSSFRPLLKGWGNSLLKRGLISACRLLMQMITTCLQMKL